MRATYQLRYALEPYIYTEARRTYDTGTAFLHPLYYDYPESPEAYSNKNEYAFGETMIVSPVVTPVDVSTKLAKETVWLPAGDWIEWSSGKHISGPASMERSFAIDEVPVYLKKGSIVPMQPPMQYTEQKPVDPLILDIWPQDSEQASAYTLYEDGGDAETYKRGVFAQTAITATQNGETLKVTIDGVRGNYPGMLPSRAYELRAPDDWPPVSVNVNGRPLMLVASDAKGPGYYYNGDTLTTIIRVGSLSVADPVQIEIHRAPSLESKTGRALLDGFPGSIRRLRSAYDTLNGQWPFSVPSEALVDALQTGDRMSYYPQTAAQELSKFAAKYSAAQASIQALLDTVAKVSDDQLVAGLMKGHGAEATTERAKNYRRSLEQAIAQLKDGRPN
jgi:alpha-glucosidase